MVKVVGVKFKDAGKAYFFAPGKFEPKAGEAVIVETARGLEYGTVSMCAKEVTEEEIVAPLKEIVRIATPQDKAQVEKNKKKEKEAFLICEEKIAAHKLDMKLVDVEYTFDGNKILFYFTAEGRVDFRELVKDLAAVFRTRIELRQIGIRDEAKMLGGIGICGRGLCCSTYLDGFDPVSIKMAKEQGLSLNPTKISGNCGRLMCCLKYEQNCYDEFYKIAPSVGAIVSTPKGKGVVQSITMLKGIAKVKLDNETESQLEEINFSDIKVIKNNHKNDDKSEADMKALKKAGGKLMKIVLLDAGTIGSDIDFSSIDCLGECVKYHNTQPDEVPERIKDADVVIINKVLLNESVLCYAQKLRLICVFAIGYNNIDIEYCRKRGIKVRNVPGYCVESVCQHTFAILFALLEKLRYYDDFVKNGEYTRSGMANHLGKPFFEISGKKWGIIGMGAIGRAVADCAAAFGAEVCYSSISGAVRKEKYENVPLDTLLRESDIISVHAPLNEKTVNLIGAEEFKKMKKTACIVNVGRGAIIDEAALADAINSGVIAGVALDVYTQEPPKENSPILSIKDSERVVYTPHIAWASVEARQRCVDMTAENVKAFTENKSLHDVWE